MPFKDRADAGRQLATRLAAYTNRSDVIVLALPRGGVPVGHEVAMRLHVPLDVFLVRKLGVPGHVELAMGAIAEGGVEVLTEDLIRDVGVPRALVQQVAVRERLELERRDQLYRGGRPLAPVRGYTVILIDDGLATGSSMQAAAIALKRLAPARIIVAVPVGARETCVRLSHVADEVVCLEMPEPFQAVGLWYEEFGQTTDEEVSRLLASIPERTTTTASLRPLATRASSSWARPAPSRRGLGAAAAGQAGDTQGLSRTKDADSESVEELLEEGQTFEAGVLGGVEHADADQGEVRTTQVLEDDVPREYDTD